MSLPFSGWEQGELCCSEQSNGLTELKIGAIYHFPAICKLVTRPAKIRLGRTPVIRKSNLRYLISGSLLSVPTAPVRTSSLALFQGRNRAGRPLLCKVPPALSPHTISSCPRAFQFSSKAAARAFGALPSAGHCCCLWVFWKGSQPHVSLALLCLHSNTSSHSSPWS